MKILYIVNARIPTEKAHGVQIMKMCQAFAAAGAAVELVVPRRRRDSANDPFEWYGVPRTFRIRKIGAPDIYGLGRLGFVLGSFFFAIAGWWHAVLYGRGAIVYSRDQDRFSFLPLLFTGRKVFFEIHGFKDDSRRHRLLVRRADGLIATNSFIADQLSKLDPSAAQKTLRLPNGVDIEQFGQTTKAEARQKLGLKNEARIAVYVGHLYAWKGADILVDAARLLAGAEFHIVGGADEDRERIRKDKGPAPANLHFAGYRPYTEVPLWYAAADALVITGTAADSDSLRHTSPIKLFECMAARRPVVAARTPSVEDVVSADEVFFYEPDRPDSLVAALTAALSAEPSAQPDIQGRVEKLSRKAAQYSWNGRAARILRHICQYTNDANVEQYNNEKQS